MLRSFLIYLSKAGWARRLTTALPFARRTARRFVAGESIEAALQAVGELNKAGMQATLDLLGEHTQDSAAANEARLQIQQLLTRVAQSGLRSNVSIKLTQIGLKLDEALCAQHLKAILDAAALLGLFVRIDMEEAAHVPATLRLYRQLRAAGHENVGVVIQSALYRSEEDVLALLQEGARIRLVKGAYMEAHEVAYPRKKDVDAAYDRLADLMLHASIQPGLERGGGGTWPPLAAVATHDTSRIEFVKRHATEIGLPKEHFEFQMLFGIRREVQTQLVQEGYGVRVYVPFGREWYPYFMRRLAERPANLWFFLSNLLRR
ncbi:MAG TPA: proline dehydrogenase family protein [Anaerolineales bacterium]|nr:proline dehydrogenase family protein [Anaerolineales bacterium]